MSLTIAWRPGGATKMIPLLFPYIIETDNMERKLSPMSDILVNTLKPMRAVQLNRNLALAAFPPPFRVFTPWCVQKVQWLCRIEENKKWLRSALQDHNQTQCDSRARELPSPHATPAGTTGVKGVNKAEVNILSSKQLDKGRRQDQLWSGCPQRVCCRQTACMHHRFCWIEPLLRRISISCCGVSGAEFAPSSQCRSACMCEKLMQLKTVVIPTKHGKSEIVVAQIRVMNRGLWWCW